MFELQDPPQNPRKTTVRVPQFIAFLDANPGQWASFKRYRKEGHVARKRVYEYRQRYGRAGYEFTHQTDANNLTTIYGRKII